MLVLNKDKENLLVEKYGFKPKENINKNIYYDYGKSFTIYCNGKIQTGTSLTKTNQDILYKLIKDDVLLLVPNENKQAKIIELKNKINTLQEKLKKYEEEK